MLDLSKLELKTIGEEESRFKTMRGELLLTHEQTVDRNANVPHDYLKLQAKDAIWQCVYGDLMSDLIKVKLLALRYVPLDQQSELQSACGRLSNLLQRNY